MLTFIRKVYQNKKKDYHILLLIMGIMASFEFCCLAIYTTLDSLHQHDLISTIVFNIIPTIGVFIALILSTFILKYFIENKQQEFSILLLSGRKPKDLFVYIVIQFGFISLFAFFIGILGGVIIMTCIQFIIHKLYLHVLFSYSFINTLFIYLCFLIFTIIFALTVCSHQFVVLDKDLVNYLNQKKVYKENPYKAYTSAMSMVTGKKVPKKIPIFSILGSLMILYMTGYSFVQLLLPGLDLVYFIVYYMAALIGMMMIVNKSIPLIYDLCHYLLLKHPILLNGIACFNDFNNIMVTLMNLNAIIIPSIVFIAILTGQDIRLQIVFIPCCIMILIMISLCFILKYTFYDHNIRENIATYHAIGYNKQQLSLILTIKNIIFFILGVILPMTLFIVLIYKAIIYHYLSQPVGLFLSMIYILIYICILIDMLIKEKTMLEEVTSHVKYINRGQ